ncbi:aminotransferase class IV [Algoriphagus machipongonensis]|uniref:branched-chain-amino-acid transaminase n=1 Tax=Algoriphagus machipongonensis TaxID=388413 RepID=A3HTK0_9BACT|nr:aminotransferase class IV [Algoriphagus machipongonensis]EAZ83168.1 putative 4-amino-4-deoxychorismate lyase [Algoriphagus machipongonensis]
MSDFETNYVFDDKLMKWDSADSFPISNRGMNFGDGLFESMVFKNGEIRFSEKHEARLKKGLELLGLSEDKVDIDGLEKFLESTFGKKSLRIRWNVFRAKSGTYTPQSSEVHQILFIKEFSKAPEIKKLAFITNEICLFPNPWSQLKTLNSLPYVLANKEREEKKMDEVILLDQRGFISEAGSANIFWKIGSEIFTPSLRCSCLAGVGRGVIIEALTAKGLELHEGSFLPEHLAKADTVWVSNAMGISYLGKIGLIEYSTKPLSFLEGLFD